MLFTFQPLSSRAQQREREAIAAAVRNNNNIVSQRGMFNMQLKVPSCPFPHPPPRPPIPTPCCSRGYTCRRSAGAQSHL